MQLVFKILEHLPYVIFFYFVKTILGRVSTHIFFLIYYFPGKKYNFMHFERHFYLSKMHKIRYIFQKT